DAFLGQLTTIWARRVVHYQLDAQNQALQVAIAAKKALGLRPTGTILEFACGACNALDEFSYYLTPRQFGDESALTLGTSAGIGVELIPDGTKLVVSHVVPNSPAAKAGLNVGDEITRIDGESPATVPLDTATERLHGVAGSTVALDVRSADEKVRHYLL